MCSHDEYWIDHDAIAPVLLIDQATEAITEAVHRFGDGTAPGKAGRLTEWLDALRVSTLDARQAAQGVQPAGVAIGSGSAGHGLIFTTGDVLG